MKIILNGKLYIQKKDLIFLLGEDIEADSSIFLREYNDSYSDDVYIPIEDKKLSEYIINLNYIIDKEETMQLSIEDLEYEFNLAQSVIDNFYCSKNKKNDESKKNIKRLILKRNDLEDCLDEKYLQYRCIKIGEITLNPGIRMNEKILVYYKKNEFEKNKDVK